MIEDKLIAELIGAKLAEHVERKQDESFEALQYVEQFNNEVIELRVELKERNLYMLSTSSATYRLMKHKELRTEAMEKYLQFINE